MRNMPSPKNKTIAKKEMNEIGIVYFYKLDQFPQPQCLHALKMFHLNGHPQIKCKKSASDGNSHILCYAPDV